MTCKPMLYFACISCAVGVTLQFVIGWMGHICSDSCESFGEAMAVNAHALLLPGLSVIHSTWLGQLYSEHWQELCITLSVIGAGV